MSAMGDKAAVQLEERVKSKDETEYLTTGYGSRIADKLNALTVGPKGPVLLQDVVYLDEMAHFDRERIPPRVVHAKGAAAFGYFEVTHDITEYTRAKVFTPGTKTDVAVRFSFVGGEQGAADTSRDLRGFAIKFYTEEGNWDLVGNNTPIFFIRDPLLFPSLIHSQKKNPVTNLKDFDMFWDFLSLRPETTHQVLWLFADRGIPDGYRHMHGHGSHTFKLVNAQNEGIYCKFHFKTDQGIRNLMSREAFELTAEDPDYATRDLYDAIEAGQCPSWTLYIQVMTFDQARESSFNPFDVTKVWPHKLYPPREVGKLCLNKNPENYFSDVEQLAFSPSSMVPGIEPSPDKLLQGRLFSYPDTHRYRLGTNFLQIPVNCTYKTVVKNYQQDGSMRGKQGGAPNYFPNSFGGPVEDPSVRSPAFQVCGDVDRWNSEDEDNFTQAGNFYREVLSAEEKDRLVQNLASSLKNAKKLIWERAVNNFEQADPELGTKVRERLNQIP